MQILPMATWNEMRSQFVEGRGTITSLCQKYGANLATAYARANRERWTRLRRDRGQAQLAALVPTVAPPPPPVPPTPEGEASTHAQKLATLEKQISAVDLLIDAGPATPDWDRLTKAKERLCGLYFWLAGVPRPGSLRHKPAKPGRQRQVTVGPVELPASNDPVEPASLAMPIDADLPDTTAR